MSSCVINWPRQKQIAAYVAKQPEQLQSTPLISRLKSKTRRREIRLKDGASGERYSIIVVFFMFYQ